MRVPVAFLDARQNDLSPRELVLLLILESYCRARAYTWVGNAELAAAYGATERAVQQILADLERRGAIHRVVDGEGRTKRHGVVLLRRSDPDRPTADAESLPAVIEQMKAAGGTKKSSCKGVKKPAPRPHEESCALNEKSLSSKKDEPEEDATGPGTEFFERQRPEPPRPTPLQTVSAPPVV